MESPNTECRCAVPPELLAEQGVSVYFFCIDGISPRAAVTRRIPVTSPGADGVIMDRIDIDGSYGEGGGQVLRTALAMSIITGRPIFITNIRAGRRKPGLAPQHLTAVRAATVFSNAEVRGDSPGSTRLDFRPGTARAGGYELDVGTAGAVTLAVQTVLPPALHLGLETTWFLTGGTDVSWSPTSSYFELIYCRQLRDLGYDLRVRTPEHGFYPRGGGRMEVVTGPGRSGEPVDLSERGDFMAVEVESIASRELEKSRVAERQVDGVRKILGNITVLRSEYVRSRSTGTAVFCRARYEKSSIGTSCLGKRGFAAEKVGTTCARLLQSRMERSGALDVHMTDQILPYLAVRGGRVTTGEISDHTRTNIHVIGLFGPRLEIVETPPFYSIQIGFA